MMTLVLLVLTTAAFEAASLAGHLAPNPVSQIVVLAALLILLGLKPGFDGWQWRNRALDADGYRHEGMVRARSERAAIGVLARAGAVGPGGIVPG
jgi:hypothetical protein